MADEMDELRVFAGVRLTWAGGAAVKRRGLAFQPGLMAVAGGYRDGSG